jgi:hypothetical protein
VCDSTVRDRLQVFTDGIDVNAGDEFNVRL